MKNKSIIALILIILLLFGATYITVFGVPVGVFDVSVVDNIKQGLDLTGGVYVVYQAESPENVEDFSSKMDGAMSVLRNRLDKAGYTEATVVKQGTNRIRVEVPINKSSNLSKASTDQVIEFIGKPAHIQFKDPDGNVIVEGSDIKSAGVSQDQNGKYAVSIDIGGESQSNFANATAVLAGTEKPISILLDDTVISSPTVNSAIPNGSGQITGTFTYDQAKLLAVQIESGAIPLELSVFESKSISATLGEEALNNSIIAGLIGMALVFILMLSFYRLSGLVANFALLLYIVLLLFCCATINGVQLTLPSIAGVILSIGMAVDANVVIFERLKEELRAGKTMDVALNLSFNKAFRAILDANVTTMIAAVVIYVLGSGSLKGFAITLALGIVCSMVTAIAFTRSLMRLVVKAGVTKPSLYARLLSEKSKERLSAPDYKPFDFIKTAKWFALFSGIVIIAGVAFGIFRGWFNLGLDFTGGETVTFNMPSADYDTNDITAVLEQNGVVDAQVQRAENTAIVRMKAASLDVQTALNDKIAADLNAMDKYSGVTVGDTDSVTAVASSEMVRNAFLQVVIALVLMLIYIWIRFEFFMGVAAMISLVHDVFVMIAVVIITGQLVNSSFIAAILTIVGYSINATIIIFDRVREHHANNEMANDRRLLVNTTLSETLLRSVNTSATTLITITLVYVMGVESIKEFALPLIVGISAGAYSAIFLSASIWHVVNLYREKRGGVSKKRAGKIA